VNYDIHNGWPYKHIEHWPPMTYRDRSPPSPENFISFLELLKTENNDNRIKELQPWLPFCEGKCSFCYFTVNCEKNNVSPYISALKKALVSYSKTKYVSSSVFNELYIGGGSPSVISNEQIADLLDFCRITFNLKSDHTTKFTACTTNLSLEKINVLSSNNVKQLDIGIQTFNDSLRKKLMIRDNSKDAKEKLQLSRKSGLRISIDLLYNLPGQTLNHWIEDINQAIELEVESVDCYPLDLYPKTTLAKRISDGELPPVGNEDIEMKMYLEAYRIFKENGYKPTCHNRFSRIKEDFKEPSSEVVGTGAGFFMGHLNRFLYSDLEDLQIYINAVKDGTFPIARLTSLSKEEEMRKAMMLIYIRVPVNRKLFRKEYGKFPEEMFPEALERLTNKGLVEIRNGNIQLTEKGDPWRFNIAWEFFKNNNI
jgi:oxygen-independent coproporphyrinogen-3 oxidase